MSVSLESLMVEALKPTPPPGIEDRDPAATATNERAKILPVVRVQIPLCCEPASPGLLSASK